MARSTLSYQKWPLIVTGVGLGLSGWLGWTTTGTYGGMLSFLFVGAILAALEIALSFDNAIVNANKLEEMTPVWQRRFLTWGILIAVFGMRIVFPWRLLRFSHGSIPLLRCTWRCLIRTNIPASSAKHTVRSPPLVGLSL